MSEFGQVINPGYDPSKNDVFHTFSEYFGNPMLTKIKNIKEFSVYMVKIHSMLGNAYRYLILFVSLDVNVVGHTKAMIEFEWISLQTRTLEDVHNIKSHKYNVRRMSELTQKIKIQYQNETESVYNSVTYPLVITLLHTRKNNSYQYQQTGTIVSALETYQTIINFRE
jgi:hypothetical protein